MDDFIENLKNKNGEYILFIGNLKERISNLSINNELFKKIKRDISLKYKNKKEYKLKKCFFNNLVYETISINNKVSNKFYREKLDLINNYDKNILIKEYHKKIDKYSIPIISNYDFILNQSIVEYFDDILSILFITENNTNYIKLILNINENSKKKIIEFIKQFNKNFL